MSMLAYRPSRHQRSAFEGSLAGTFAEFPSPSFFTTNGYGSNPGADTSYEQQQPVASYPGPPPASSSAPAYPTHNCSLEHRTVSAEVIFFRGFWFFSK